MNHAAEHLTFRLDNQHPQFSLATVVIPAQDVAIIYNQALLAQKSETHTFGFSKGDTPLSYIEQHFRPFILNHLKEFLLTHYVIGFLSKSLRQEKVVIAGDPLLMEITISAEKDAVFSFLLNRIVPDREERWKKLSMKAPERKNYKDLDRQVENFIKEESEKQEKFAIDTISFGDWVCFEMFIASATNEFLSPHKDQLWVKISDEEADLELHKLFIGKKRGEVFFSQNSYLQDFMSNEMDMRYNFGIKIIDFVPYSYFSFDHFKKHFQIKNLKDMHHKLIEVFSFRNDMSQRRETIEATFKLLFKHYTLALPKHLLDQKKAEVLDKVHENPDYLVYKAQKDFKEQVFALAEKQLKEMVITDTIGFGENIEVDHDDISCYLNLIKRPRTKEFVHFEVPQPKMQGHELPISSEVLKLFCLREKTLNYVIHHLTKKS